MSNIRTILDPIDDHHFYEEGNTLKIYCECGGVIVDQTDYLPNKAYLISDQDWFDFLEKIDSSIEKSGPTQKDKERALMEVRVLAGKLSKLVYQCSACGRLFIENGKVDLETFIKTGLYDGNSILASAHGANWKRPLIGDWHDNRKGPIKGFLWCMDVKNGEEFDSWERLEKEYYDVFEDLKNKKILRSALLKKNYEVIHSWSMEIDS